MTATPKYTTLAAWPLAICKALESAGIDPNPLLKSASLKRSDFIDQPDGRVDVALMTQFWQAVATKTQNPAFGLSVAKYVQPMHFRALGMLMLTDTNLESAITKLGQYSELVSNSVTTCIEYTPELIGLCFDHIANVQIHPMATDSFFATITTLCKQMGANNDLVSHVQLKRPQPKYTSKWHHCFNASVEFSAPRDCLWIKRKELTNATTMGDKKLAAFNESVVVDYITDMNTSQISIKVKNIITISLENGEPNLESIAKQLNMSERSLRRRLREEDITYRQVLKNTRMELASYYLTNTQLPITQISYKLGFTDTSNFSRAFTRWFNQTPSLFRNTTSNKS
ncbi:MAG: AraC-like DNA-binding protein [Crocinitomicaceae bacterium]|jgi:AraC-like DNA-binding protein